MHETSTKISKAVTIIIYQLGRKCSHTQICTQTEKQRKGGGKIKQTSKHNFFFLLSLFLRWLILRFYDETKLYMVAGQMNELSIEVERAAPPCALAVRGTTWTSFVYSSCPKDHHVDP
jgi:hypothetical protein